MITLQQQMSYLDIIYDMSLNIFSLDPEHLNSREYFYQEQWLNKAKKFNGIVCRFFEVHILKMLPFIFLVGEERRGAWSQKKLLRWTL